MFDSALFMFLLGNKRWLCACVFSCWFFKEMGRKKIPPLSSLFPSLSVFPTPHAALFSVFLFSFFFSPVLFCYESTFLFVILGSPRFLFSVKSPYASSALRLLLPSSRPNGLGGAWPAPFPPRLCSSLSTPAQRREPASGRRPAHLALSERHLGAPGRGADLMSRLGGEAGDSNQRLELATLRVSPLW